MQKRHIVTSLCERCWYVTSVCIITLLYYIVCSLSTLSAGSIWEDRGEGGLLTGGIKEFSAAIWDSATLGRTSHGCVCVCECVCMFERECVRSFTLPLCFTFPPPLVSPLCLSLCNKAEYLFPPLWLSGLLKGVGDWADIRLYVCVCMCDTLCVCSRCCSLTLTLCCLLVSSPIPNVQLRLLAC